MTVSLSIADGVAYVRLDNPPVNGLSHAMRQELFKAFTSLKSRAGVRGVVLHGAGRGFSAGGDTREVGTPAAIAEPGLSAALHPAIETCGKPVVAAIHGFAVGGGLETALACHGRVAERGARVGLPEGKLGVIPLSGTQRLPRLIGLEAALAMILDGDLRAAESVPGLFDAIVGEGEAVEAAARLALELADGSPVLVRDLRRPIDTGALAQARAAHPDGVPRQLVEALAASAESATFDEGMVKARWIYEVLHNRLSPSP